MSMEAWNCLGELAAGGPLASRWLARGRLGKRGRALPRSQLAGITGRLGRESLVSEA